MTARTKTAMITMGIGIAGLRLAVGTMRSRPGPGNAVTKWEEGPAGPEGRPPILVAAERPHEPGAPAPRKRASLPVLRISVRGPERGVKDAEVTIRTKDEVLSVQTNPRGRAKARIAGPGRVSIFAEAKGFTSASGEVEVTEGGGAVDLVLQQGGTLLGRVAGYEGQLPYLSVLARAENGAVKSALVSAAGEFRIDRLEAGTYALRMNPSGFDATPVVVRVEAGQEQRVELAFAPTGTLDLTAILPFTDGEAHPATLRLIRDDEDHDQVGRSFALTSGTPLRIEAVPPGRYVTELTVEGAAEVPTQWVTITAGQVGSAMFTWPSGRLAGRVVGADGEGVPASMAVFKIVQGWDGGEVRNYKPEHVAVAGADGSYEFPGLPRGRYIVAAQHVAGLGMEEVELGDGEERSFDLHLQASRSLQARVVYAGKPVEGAMVSATSQPYALNARSGETDARGVAQLAYLTKGTYLVRALWLEGDEGPMRQASTEITVEDAGGPVELQLQ